MDFNSREAIKANRQTKHLWFDLETTGFGRGPTGKLFEHPVGIWQLGYRVGDESGSLYAETKVPFEKGSLSLFSEVEQGVPKVYLNKANGSEEALVRQFGKLIKDNPDAVISGYNINNYDIPLMIQKFKQYGMSEELSLLSKMRTNDVLIKTNSFLDQTLAQPVKAVLGLDFEGNRKGGGRLEVIAQGLGIDLSKAPGGAFKAHYAEHDIWLTEEVDKLLHKPEEAAKHYDLLRHARAQDDATGASRISGIPRSTIGTPEKPMSISWVKQIEQLPSTTQLTTIPHNVSPLKEEVINQITDNRGNRIINQARASKTITDEATILLHNTKKIGGQAIERITKIAGSQDLKSILKVGGVLGGVYAISKIAEKLKGKPDTDGYISASVLGKKPEDIRRNIEQSANASSFNKRMQRDPEAYGLREGKQIRDLISSEIGKSNVGYESNVEVQDDELGIKGTVDNVIKVDGQKIPIELKSVNSEELDRLEEPRREHESQVNFYAHALNAPGGYVMYVSKDDPSKRHSFYVPYSPGKLIRDVADFREVLIQEQSKPGVAGAWGKQLNDFFEDSVPGSDYDMNQVTSRSKVRDQASRNGHLYPGGTPNVGNTYTNGSRNMRRN